MVVIKGLVKTSLIDYTPYTVAVVFLPGCTFRCHYCQNPDLVLHHYKLPTISEASFFAFLETRKKWLDGVCITGGEPTIQPDLLAFAQKIKKMGFKVKLDTMGINPSVVKELIEKQAVDYIAMDIKTAFKKYPEVVQRDADMKRIQETIDIIRTSGIDYEFRTTVVPGLVSIDDVQSIGKALKGSKRYMLQNFRPSHPLMDPLYEHIVPYTHEALIAMQESVKGYFKEVGIRE